MSYSDPSQILSVCVSVCIRVCAKLVLMESLKKMATSPTKPGMHSQSSQAVVGFVWVTLFKSKCSRVKGICLVCGFWLQTIRASIVGNMAVLAFDLLGPNSSGLHLSPALWALTLPITGSFLCCWYCPAKGQSPNKLQRHVNGKR